VCGSDPTCRQDVEGFSVVGVFDDCRRDVAKRVDEGSKLLVGKVQEFCFDQGWGNGRTCVSNLRC